MYGSVRAAIFLMDSLDADPSINDNDNWSPIHYACRWATGYLYVSGPKSHHRFGFQDLLEVLERNYRAKYEQDQRRCAPYDLLLSVRLKLITKTLFLRGISTKTKEPLTSEKWTPLHVAARFEQVDSFWVFSNHMFCRIRLCLTSYQLEVTERQKISLATLLFM